MGASLPPNPRGSVGFDQVGGLLLSAWTTHLVRRAASGVEPESCGSTAADDLEPLYQSMITITADLEIFLLEIFFDLSPSR
jgi:hypothetical protein